MHVIALFSSSPYALQPWADAGFRCINIDIKNTGVPRFGQEFIAMDLSDPRAVLQYFRKQNIRPKLIVSFPPCTDLAVSGARHFAAKRERNPDFQTKAMHLFLSAHVLANHYDVPCLIENPVSVASTLFRPPDAIISPHEYGGYLPENDLHPEWPQYIAPRDAYRKKTCYWLQNGFVLPEKKPVPLFCTGTDTAFARSGNSKQFLKLGGKSEKTKTIRSLTPRGVFIGIHEVMSPRLQVNQ